jgi:hypothetical protein
VSRHDREGPADEAKEEPIVSWRLLVALTVMLAAVPPAGAAATGDQVTYTSRPDEVAVFLNDIAYARDSVALPAGVDARIELPATTYADTLILREDGERVSPYRLERQADGLAVEWHSGPAAGAREVTLEYLLGGVGWRPRYDLWLGADTDTTVELDFLAEVQDWALPMADVETRLVAGRVDPSQMVEAMAQVSANQSIAGYQEPLVPAAPAGPVDISHVYDVGRLSAEPGDVVSVRLEGGTFPARRLHLWNAGSDDRVTVIYKVLDEGPLPFAEGIVRAYQDGLFIGSDAVEQTPVGGEGSITVGRLPDVRVDRSQRSTALEDGTYASLHEVELSVSNFGTTPVDLEIVDPWPPEAQDFHFSLEPERAQDNLLRWHVTVEPGSRLVISYDYRTE